MSAKEKGRRLTQIGILCFILSFFFGFSAAQNLAGMQIWFIIASIATGVASIITNIIGLILTFDSVYE